MIMMLVMPRMIIILIIDIFQWISSSPSSDPAIQPSILGRGVALCMTRLSLFVEAEFDGTRQRRFLFKRWFTMNWNWNSRNFNKILIFYCIPLFQFCLVLFVDGFCTRFIRLNLNVIGNSWNFNRIQKNTKTKRGQCYFVVFFFMFHSIILLLLVILLSIIIIIKWLPLKIFFFRNLLRRK